MKLFKWKHYRKGIHILIGLKLNDEEIGRNTYYCVVTSRKSKFENLNVLTEKDMFGRGHPSSAHFQFSSFNCAVKYAKFRSEEWLRIEKYVRSKNRI
mgnify:CR=1 FL=1